MSWRESVPNFGRAIFYILLSLGHYSNAIKPLNRFLVHPDEVLYRDEGSNVVFEWDFYIGSRTKVIEFLFGEWAFPGYVRKKILSVQGHNQVKKQRGFEKKVDWRGNIYKCVNCKAVVVMYNLTRADFKSYGVDIELGVDRSPLTNWLRLVKTAIYVAPNDTIRGFYGERLDILCPLHFPNITEQQIILYINSRPMIIMELKKTKTPAIHCTSDHPYEKMCQTQMMNSYADKNNVHFVIDKVPETLDGSTSECVTDHDDFEKKTRRDPPRTIILRERIKGYVDGTIIIPCPIPNGHREWFVGLKINMTNRAQVWNQSTDDFHCVTGSHYFNVCRNHMNGSSYVNGSSVFFVLENTPAFLNNSELYCFAMNFVIHKENDHDALEKILTLYKEDSPTSTATVNTTTSTIPSASTKAPKENLTWLWILLAVIIIIVVC